MGTYLLNNLANDGSRLFCVMPHTRLLQDVYAHLTQLPGVVITGMLRDDIEDAWVEFDYCHYSFVVVEGARDYRFYVNHSLCPDELLLEVLSHCSLFLMPQRFFPSGMIPPRSRMVGPTSRKGWQAS